MQNFLHACTEGEKKVEIFVDALPKIATKEQRAKNITEVSQFIQSVMGEIEARVNDDIDQLKKKSTLEIGVENVTDEQLKHIEECYVQVIHFLEELLRWATDIIAKIVIESFDGKTMVRKMTIFFQQLIEAFQQANIVDLIDSPHTA